MSTVVSQTLQLGTSATAEDNYTLAVPLNPDGSMTVTKGDRNGTEVMKFNANGSLNLKKPLSIGAGSPTTTTTIDCSNSNRYSYTATSGSQTFNFTNVPSGVFYDLILDMSVTAATTYTRPTIVGQVDATTVSGTSLSVTKPAGTQSGDYALAFITNSGTSARTFTPPTGWTEIVDANDISGPYVAFKILDGTEGASFAFTASGSLNGRMLVLIVRGATGIRAGVRSDTTTATSLDLVTPNSLVLFGGSNANISGGINFAAGTSIFNTGSLGMQDYSSVITGVAPTGTLTWTGSTTSPGSMIIAFDAASSSSAPTINWPGSITWQDGALPPVYSTTTLRISLSTYNGGTNWYGSFLSLGV